LLATVALGSAAKDAKEIYDDSKNAKNVLNNLDEKLKNLNGEKIEAAAKNLIKSPKISPAIERYNKTNAENQINETTINNTIESFGNHPELQENFQKIAGHYQNNLLSAASLGSTLKNIYNKNCKDGKSFGLTDVVKLQSAEGLVGLFDDLKPESQEKFVGLIALIANNPKIIDEFAKDPSQINKLMKECEKGNGDIDVIKEKINEMQKTTEKTSHEQERQQSSNLTVALVNDQLQSNEQPIDMAKLLKETTINQLPNNSQIPNNTTRQNVLQK